MIRYSVAPAGPQEPIHEEPFHRYTFDDGTVWTEFYRSGDRYLLRFPDLADFEVSADGTEVVAHPAEGTNAATIEHLYINQMVPLALSRQGRPAFHASVVTVEGGAVAFLGKTGMGKSTLAASFALNEAAFLTDDSLIIEEQDDGCLALPSHASVRLWEDSVDALVSDDASKAAAISYSNKARLLAGDALTYNEAPARLLAAYALVDDSDALLVAGSSLTVFSGYRFVRHAAARDIPVAIVNRGPTRGDDLATVKVDAGCSPMLTLLADELTGRTPAVS